MSEIFESNSFRNLLTFGKEESFSLQQVQPLVNRSESLFSSSSKSHSLSSDQLNGDDLSWLMDIWNDTMPQKKNSFRPDRSISLTECSNVSFGKTKTPEVSPPPGFPPLSATSLPSSRYKTELCRSFQENGSCKYGSKCQFAHGETELRGLHRHPKYKTEPCRTFYNFGYCPYGIRCHFIHEEKPSPLTLQHQSQTPGPRLLRQSVSFAGFLGSRSSPPLTVQDPLGFTRAPSVSPPPAELSPVFSETKLMKDIQFQFCRNRSSLCDVHSIPHIAKSPKTTGCVCGHTNDFPSTVNKPFVKQDDNVPQPNLQRFSSEDSLSDRDSYSSTSSSSGSESPTFDSLGVKRLNVFERLSLSD